MSLYASLDQGEEERISISKSRQLKSPLLLQFLTQTIGMAFGLGYGGFQRMATWRAAKKAAGTLVDLCDHVPSAPITADVHAWMGKALRKTTKKVPDSVRTQMESSLELASQITSEQSGALGFEYRRVRVEEFSEADRRAYWGSQVVSHINHLRSLPDALKEGIRRNPRAGGKFAAKGSPWGIFYYNETLVVLSSDAEIVVFDDETFLMFSDVVKGEWAARAAARHSITNGLGLPSPTVIGRYYRWGYDLLAEYGMQAHKVFKEIETVCTDTLCKGFSKTDDRYSPLGFLDAVLAGVQEQWMSDALLSLKEMIEDLPPAEISEIFGLYKAFGHPFVDGVTGSYAVRTLTTEVKDIDPAVVREAHRQFRKMYVTNFVKKNTRWPTLKISPPEGSYLHLCWSSSTIPSEGHAMYKIAEWDSIRFGSDCELPASLSLGDVLDDKSICPELDVFAREWEKNGNPAPRRLRNLVEVGLDTVLPAPKDLLDDIATNGYKDTEKVMLLTAKEREQKFPEARMFGQQTFRCRLVTVLTEHLVKEYILPYFPQITMSYTQSQLQQLMQKLSRKLGSARDSVTSLINMDFSKWNSNFRQELVGPFFRDMDDILGMIGPVIERTHLHFSESWMLYAGPGSTLQFRDGKPVPSACAWIGNLGGIEGLKQKPWTIITACIIARIAEVLHVTYENIGQGDNQVILVDVPVPRGITEQEESDLVRGMVDRFLGIMDERFGAVGLPLKLNETWTSSRLFAYGKNLILEGVNLPMTLKRLTRSFGSGNELIPNLGDDLAAIFSAGGSAAESSYSPLGPFFISVLNASACLRQYEGFSPLLGIPLTEAIGSNSSYRTSKESAQCARVPLPSSISEIDKLRVLSLGTRAVGLYPTMNLFDFIVKGSPDPVTSTMALARKLFIQTGQSAYLRILNIPMSDTVRKSMLIQDPLSINTMAPQSSEAILKKYSEDYLVGRGATNPPVREILSVGRDATELQEMLFDVSPCFPPLLYEILNASAIGHASKVLGKVLRMRTITAAAIDSGPINLPARLARSEIDNYKYLLITCSDHPFGYLNMYGESVDDLCTKEYSHFLRTKGWKKDDIIGVTVGCPIETLGEMGPTVLDEATDRISLILDPSTVGKPWAELLSSKGPKLPFMGTTTKEKQSKSEGMRRYDLGSITKAAAALCRVVGFAVKTTSPMQDLVFRCLASVTDADPHQFITTAASSTGSAFHRMQSQVLDKTGRLASLPHLYTYLDVHADNIKSSSRGGQNTDFVFSVQMIWAQALFVANHWGKSIWKTGFDIPVKCTRCISVIEGDVLEGDESCQRVVFPSWPNNPYLYEKERDFKLARMGRPDTMMATRLSRDQLQKDGKFGGLGLTAAMNFAHGVLSRRGLHHDEQSRVPAIRQSWLAFLAPSVWIAGLIRSIHLEARLLATRTRRSLTEEISVLISELGHDLLGAYHPLLRDPRAEEELISSGLDITIPASNTLSRSLAGLAIKDFLVGIIDDIGDSSFMVLALVCLSDGYPIWTSACVSLIASGAQGDLIRRVIQQQSRSIADDVSGLGYDARAYMWGNNIDGCVRSLERCPDKIYISRRGTTAPITLPSAADKFPFFGTDVISSDMAIPLGVHSELLHAARTPSPGTAAPVKYLSFLGCIDSLMTGHTGIGSWGDGFGGVTTLMASITGAKYAYSTLVEFSGEKESFASMMRPLAVGLASTVSPSDDLTFGSTAQIESDILSDRFVEDNVHHKRGLGLSLFIADPEGPFWGDNRATIAVRNFFKTAYHLSTETHGTHPAAIIKIYASSSSQVATFARIGQEYFQDLVLIRSWVSQASVPEFFLIGRRPGKSTEGVNEDALKIWLRTAVAAKSWKIARSVNGTLLRIFDRVSARKEIVALVPAWAVPRQKTLDLPAIIIRGLSHLQNRGVRLLTSKTQRIKITREGEIRRVGLYLIAAIASHIRDPEEAVTWILQQVPRLAIECRVNANRIYAGLTLAKRFRRTNQSIHLPLNEVRRWGDLSVQMMMYLRGRHSVRPMLGSLAPVQSIEGQRVPAVVVQETVYVFSLSAGGKPTALLPASMGDKKRATFKTFKKIFFTPGNLLTKETVWSDLGEASEEIPFTGPDSLAKWRQGGTTLFGCSIWVALMGARGDENLSALEVRRARANRDVLERLAVDGMAYAEAREYSLQPDLVDEVDEDLPYIADWGEEMEMHDRR